MRSGRAADVPVGAWRDRGHASQIVTAHHDDHRQDRQRADDDRRRQADDREHDDRGREE
jgi:hypothetical protein